MRIPCAWFLVIAASVAYCSIDRGAPLPRKGYLGVVTVADPAGLKITRVVPGATLANLGLKADDILQTVNGTKVTTPAKLVEIARAMNSGEPITLHYLRAGKPADAKGTTAERPKQVEANLDVIYDQVVSQGKRIRIIITKPKGNGPFPTLMLIGGIGGYSVDGTYSSIPYGNVLGPIANAGYVIVRCDKPGQGDSEGPVYKGLTFNVEKDAYIQTLRLAKTLPFIDPKRIAIYGHSMGGCFGPLVAAAEPVKAVIANGTLFQSWHEYMLENTRRQSALAGATEDQIDESQKQLAAVDLFIFGGDENPRQAIQRHPQFADSIRGTFPDGETYSGVGIPFFRELAHTNLAQGWKDTKADVLAVYGENDFLSGRRDHERIVEFINSLRPKTAELAILPNSDHAFNKTTSMKDSFDHWGRPGGVFNPVIVDTLLAYLRKEIG